ncbi:MAG: lytic murein transglycosylase B [Gammaproteobacteria bacterium]|nr:MAG: lytic murein transglycosylase B [Gammaproteobacteria bacterium]RKZ44213.1 MAG: lytic murein transglycosylase B [Gammaproteobacteria bacterium]RKZ75394.1 MAG: lytic murein transglycosylase B [Gammaproteobacteria bacterium]
MKFITSFTLTGLLLCNISVMAVQVSQKAFIDNMVAQHGFDKSRLIYLLSKAKVKKSILKIMSRPIGKARPWYKYRRNFITELHIKKGVKFWRKNDRVLKQAQRTYGVPAEIIVAIIGVETIYGKNKGNIRVIDALKTLAFNYPRRADFFRDELKHYLLLTREEGLNPLAQKGSYAGAMGIGQFMPSSFRRYAVDFDNNGKRNIWTDNVDAIGSVANYFREHGWQTGQPVIEATQVRPNAIEYLLALKFEPQYPIWKLKQKGLLYHGNESNNTLGLFIDLKTEIGTAYWLGFKNYYVITRYNRSKRYAMAVYQLAQEIANRYAQTY